MVERARENGDHPRWAEAVNRALMAADRPLVQVNFTAAFPFDQDLAVPVPPVPLLAPVERLASLDPAGSEARFLRTELVRSRNQVVHQLRMALEAMGRAKDVLGSG